MNDKASDMNNDKEQGADRDATSDALAREVPAEQSDDLFTDRGAQDVSSLKGDSNGENRVATSLDDE